jgi:hypothetical protein
VRWRDRERGRAAAVAAAATVGNREHKTQNTKPGTLKRYRGNRGIKGRNE